MAGCGLMYVIGALWRQFAEHAALLDLSYLENIREHVLS